MQKNIRRVDEKAKKERENDMLRMRRNEEEYGK
jgi:hypothetical protein